MSALGGPDSRVSEFPVGATAPYALTTMHITWSPDGRYVAAGRDPRAVTDDSAGIVLIPIDGGEVRAITRPRRPAFHFSPVFSPDGHHVTYHGVRRARAELDIFTAGNGHCAVGIVEIDESFAAVSAARTLTTQPHTSIPAGMAWSRDSKSIVFVGKSASPVDLWRL